MMPAPWSTCTADDLLDKAQVMYDRDAPAAAMALLAAAQVQATQAATKAIESQPQKPGRWADERRT
jgi:hypothetical protein